MLDEDEEEIEEQVPVSSESDDDDGDSVILYRCLLWMWLICWAVKLETE